MIPKNVKRFSDKIMRQKNVRGENYSDQEWSHDYG
jgi:hypothetical protein